MLPTVLTAMGVIAAVLLGVWESSHGTTAGCETGWMGSSDSSGTA